MEVANQVGLIVVSTPDGGIRPGWRCRLSLVFDRRTFDDFSADRFLGAITEELLRVPAR